MITKFNDLRVELESAQVEPSLASRMCLPIIRARRQIQQVTELVKEFDHAPALQSHFESERAGAVETLLAKLRSQAAGHLVRISTTGNAVKINDLEIRL